MPNPDEQPSTAPRSPRAFQCPMPSGCPRVCYGSQSLNITCAEGYGGALCGTCSHNFYRTATRCMRCDGTAWTLTKAIASVGLLCALVVLCLAGPVRKYSHSFLALVPARLASRSGTLLKISIGWVQSFMVVTLLPQLQLPSDLAWAFNWFQSVLTAVSFDVFELVPLECVLSDVSFYTKLLATMFLPLALCQLLLLLASATATFIWRQPVGAILASPRFCQLCFWLLLVSYPSISRTIFSTFIFVEMDEQRLVRADTSLPFGDGRWACFGLVATIGTVLFTLGVPYLLYRVARSVCGPEASPSQRRRECCSLLLSSYLPGYWWFESADMLRKLLNTSIVAIVWQGTDLQLWFAAVSATLSLFAYTLMQPYHDQP
jgi:hypothetical protein